MKKYKSDKNLLGLVKKICDDCGKCSAIGANEAVERKFRIVVRKSQSGNTELYGLECVDKDMRVF